MVVILLLHQEVIFIIYSLEAHARMIDYKELFSVHVVGLTLDAANSDSIDFTNKYLNCEKARITLEFSRVPLVPPPQ